MQLLDNKRCMNVSIFLRQFPGQSHADIAKLIRTGESHKLGVDRLQSLQKILPDEEEVKLLKKFTDCRDRLGQAERFYVELITIPK